MTVQKAIEILSEIRCGYNCFDESERPFYEALSEAIEALTHFNSDSNSIKNELNELSCSEKPNRSDLISRQGMCDSLNKYRIEKMLEGKDVSLVWECIDKVLQEPSAQPENTCENTYDFARISNGKDTVYRKDMIEMIQGVPISSGTTKAMLMFRAKELPSAQPERKKGEWIPTKIAKPPKAGQYLVTKQQKTGACQIATAHYNPSFDEWSGNGNFKKILAWQPLPSPYTQE